MNLFRLSLEMNGYRISKAQQLLSEIQNLKFKEFQYWKEMKCWEIFNKHYQYNKFYRTLVEKRVGHKPVAWSEVPILSKQDYQHPIREMLSFGFNFRNIYVSNTSGSSGHPFFFAKDKFCHAMTWGLNIDRYRLHGIQYGNSLQARFYGISLDFKKNFTEHVKDLISARKRFDLFDLSDQALDGFIKKFSFTKFNYINGYTSVLVLFAKYLVNKNLVLNKICPTLKTAITTSEVLNDSDRALLQKGFGVPVVNEYGASELDIIAFEDQDFDWIISNENLLVEIVDDEGKLLPDGEEGRIIVTSLHNEAMPFIRYEIGDIGCISRRRKGKYQILESLKGRTNDFILLPSGKKSPGLTFYYISKKLLEEGSSIKEFIIKQKAISHFHIEYVADTDLSEEIIHRISKAMDDYLEPELKVTFSRFNKLVRDKSGKLMHFKREF